MSIFSGWQQDKQMAQSEFWAASAAIRAQDIGPDFFAPIDDHPGSEISGFYRGFTTSFRLKAGRNTWFHCPLPTPTLLNDTEISLSRVSLLWDQEDGAQLSWITLHHGGANRIELTERAKAVTGEVHTEFTTPHGLKIRTLRADFPIASPLRTGMGLQLCIHGEALDTAGTLRFFGAGALFSHD